MKSFAESCATWIIHPWYDKTIALMKTTKAQIPDFNSEIMKRNKNYGGKILSTMGADVTPNVLNIHLLFCLKDVQVGWTMKDRKSYLGELQNLMTKKGGKHVYWLHSKNP